MPKIEQYIKSLCPIGLKGTVFLVCWGLACQVRSATPEQIIAGIDGRIDQVFLAESGDPYALEKVKASLDNGRPYYARAYSWSVVGYAARCFRLNQSLAAANARLQQNARYYLRELTIADEAEILPAEAEKNTSTYSRIVDRDSLHWHADMVLRLIEMYGSNGSVAPGRMDAATEAKCLEPIWHYVRLVSRLEKAEFRNSKAWYLWESENHHVQCFSIAWHFSKIAKDLPLYQNRTYNDGSTPGELFAAWNSYFVEYVRERFRKGLFVEMMSQGYNSESIRGIYNFYDFGDSEVRQHAGMYLDLFWAYWAQEQFDDVLGGGMARRTLSGVLNVGHGGLTSNMANLYFGLGAQADVDGHSVNPLLSGYRPKPVIADIAVDVAGRGTYEVRQTAQGLGQAGTTNWNQSLNLNPYKLNTNGGGIVRYSYCTPSFIMGTPMFDARPLSDWVAISSQGRQQSVIFSGAAEAARIVPCVLPPDERYTRNGFWTVQSKGSMITQMLNTSDGANEMWAWISKSGLTDPVQEGGIYFVETDEANGAYAAIRTVGTTFTLIEDRAFSTFTPPSHWIVELNDKFKPLVLEVMAKDQVADFAAFKALVKSKTPTLASGLVTYTTIYGDVLTLDTTYNNAPTVNGVAVDYSPSKSYDSPFLSGDYNGETFLIEKGSRREAYSFPSPPLVTGFSPADNSVNVAIDANLAVTFNEAISAGTGLITLKNLTDSTQSTIDITDATQVSVSGATLTINPTNNLLNSAIYAIQIASGAVEDGNGAGFPGIANDTTWNFSTVVQQDFTPPSISALSPADNATGASAFANLVVTFDEPVQAGTGSIVLRKSSDGSTVQTFNVATDVVFNGMEVTVNPTVPLANTTGYHVTIDATAVEDVSGNAFAGIADSGTWNFTTREGGIDITNTAASVVFNGSTSAGTVSGDEGGTISSFALNGGNTVVFFFSIENATDKQLASLDVTFAGEAMTVVHTPDVLRHSSAIAYIINPMATTGDIAFSWEATGAYATSEGVYSAIALGNVASVLGSTSRDTPGTLTLNYTSTVDGGCVVGAANNNASSGGANAAPGFSGDFDTNLFRDIASGNTGVIHIYGDIPTAGSSSSSLGDLLGASSGQADSSAIIAFEASLPSRPNIVSTSPPALNAAVDANLVATFDEPVRAGTGEIVLKRSSDNSTVQTFDVTTDVVFSGSQFTVNPASDLSFSTQYHLEIGTDAVENLAGNGFAGLSGSSAWSFTTEAFHVVNSGSSVDGTIDATAGGKTITIDAGVDAQFLIVATNTEFGAGTIGGWSATYDGNPMTLATGNGSQSMIFYLDLTRTTYAGGNAPLTFAWDYTAGGDLGVGWVSIRTDLEPGESIGLHSTAIAGSGISSVNLVTTADATFNFVNFNANKDESGAVAAPSTTLWGPQNFGSNAGAAGYENNVAAATHNYSWAASPSRRIDAAAFAITNGIVPGPVARFEISAISSPQMVGTPIIGITITALDAFDNTATGFTGTVDFGGTGGFSGTSAGFTAGVLTGVSATPTVAGSDLTLTVDDGSDHTGSTTIATIESQDPYADWSGGAPFNGDSNGDGVQDGLAFVLGAPTIGTNAIGLLPTAVEKNNGDLELTFTMLDSASRGGATLSLQWSRDLGISDPWSGNQALVPDATPDPQVAPVNFQVSGSGTLTVVATIAASEAAGGKVFGRLSGWIPPAAETQR